MQNSYLPFSRFVLKSLLIVASYCMLSATTYAAEPPERTISFELQISEDVLLSNKTDSLRQEPPPPSKWTKKQPSAPILFGLDPVRPATTIEGFEELQQEVRMTPAPFIVNDDIVMLLDNDEFWLRQETVQSRQHSMKYRKRPGLETPDYRL